MSQEEKELLLAQEEYENPESGIATIDNDTDLDEKKKNLELLAIKLQGKKKTVHFNEYFLNRILYALLYFKKSSNYNGKVVRKSLNDEIVALSLQWQLPFDAERPGSAIREKSIRNKKSQLRTFWRFWLGENILSLLRNTGQTVQLRDLISLSEINESKIFDFISRIDLYEGPRKNINELSFKEILLLSTYNSENAPFNAGLESLNLHIATANPLIPFPRDLLSFFQMENVTVLLEHFVQKSIIVCRMAPSSISLILGTLRTHVLVYYRWQVGSKAHLQKILITLDNLLKQLLYYSRIERKRFSSANSSFTWLDFQLTRITFCLKLATFLISKFKPAVFDPDRLPTQKFKTGTILNKSYNGFEFLQLATGISQLFLFAFMSGPTLRPDILPKIKKQALQFNPFKLEDTANRRWVYSYVDSFLPSAQHKTSASQTSYLLPLPHFYLPIKILKEQKDEWKKLINKIQKGAWCEQEIKGVIHFSFFNLVACLYLQGNSLRTQADSLLRQFRKEKGSNNIFLFSTNRVFDSNKTFKRQSQTSTTQHVSENTLLSTMRLLYKDNFCQERGQAEEIKPLQKDTTLKHCRHLYETASRIIVNNIKELGISDFPTSTERRTQESVINLSSRLSLHSALTAETSYVANKVFWQESMLIVDMLDRLIATNVLLKGVVNKTKDTVIYQYEQKGKVKKLFMVSKKINSLFKGLREKNDEDTLRRKFWSFEMLRMTDRTWQELTVKLAKSPAPTISEPPPLESPPAPLRDFLKEKKYKEEDAFIQSKRAYLQYVASESTTMNLIHRKFPRIRYITRFKKKKIEESPQVKICIFIEQKWNIATVIYNGEENFDIKLDAGDSHLEKKYDLTDNLYFESDSPDTSLREGNWVFVQKIDSTNAERENKVGSTFKAR